VTSTCACGEDRINLSQVRLGDRDHNSVIQRVRGRTGGTNLQNGNEPKSETVTHRPVNAWRSISALVFGRSSLRRAHDSALRDQSSFEIAPERDHQFARQCHDSDQSDPPLGIADALSKPPAQSAFWLVTDPQPGDLDGKPARGDCLTCWLGQRASSRCIGARCFSTPRGWHALSKTTGSTSPGADRPSSLLATETSRTRRRHDRINGRDSGSKRSTAQCVRKSFRADQDATR
jgi:hypothetical protein